jgi:transcription initiation factor TFIIIB Brf1 subunit/transcription initiation factor TFIIB
MFKLYFRNTLQEQGARHMSIPEEEGQSAKPNLECPICGSNNDDVIFNQIYDDDKGEADGYVCINCGCIIRLKPALTEVKAEKATVKAVVKCEVEKVFSLKRDRRHNCIMSFLQKTPATFKEIKKQLAKLQLDGDNSIIYHELRQIEDIQKIGPRRKTVYYLKGQETQAKEHLSEIAPHTCSRDTIRVTVASFLQKTPATFKEIREHLADKLQFDLEQVVIYQELRQIEDIQRIGPRRKTVYYLKGQETQAKEYSTKISPHIINNEELLNKMYTYLQQSADTTSTDITDHKAFCGVVRRNVSIVGTESKKLGYGFVDISECKEKICDPQTQKGHGCLIGQHNVSTTQETKDPNNNRNTAINNNKNIQ